MVKKHLLVVALIAESAAAAEELSSQSAVMNDMIDLFTLKR